MPALLRVRGYRFFFFSLEGREFFLEKWHEYFSGEE